MVYCDVSNLSRGKRIMPAWFVNAHQTQEERRHKFALSRNAGYPSREAERHRDWRYNVLIGFLEGHNLEWQN